MMVYFCGIHLHGNASFESLSFLSEIFSGMMMYRATAAHEDYSRYQAAEVMLRLIDRIHATFATLLFPIWRSSAQSDTNIWRLSA